MLHKALYSFLCVRVWFLSTGPKRAAQRQHWNLGLQGRRQYSRGFTVSFHRPSTVCHAILQYTAIICNNEYVPNFYCSVLQRAAACCSVLQCVAVCSVSAVVQPPHHRRDPVQHGHRQCGRPKWLPQRQSPPGTACETLTNCFAKRWTRIQRGKRPEERVARGVRVSTERKSESSHPQLHVTLISMYSEDSCWVMPSHAESFWVMLCWVMPSHAESCWVILSHAGWSSLNDAWVVPNCWAWLRQIPTPSPVAHRGLATQTARWWLVDHLKHLWTTCG